MPSSSPFIFISSSVVIIINLFISPSTSSLSSHSCSSSYKQRRSESIPCPPFRSPPTSFPLASSPGCGHPSFQIHCRSPHSLITINSSPFSILDHPTSNSFTLTPFVPNLNNSFSCPSLPTHPINLSSSPFRLSSSSDLCHRLCHRLCTSFSFDPFTSFTNKSSSFCNFTSWQLNLLSNPQLLLLPSCPPTTTNKCPHPTHNVSLIYSSSLLADVLRTGIRVEWDLSDDPYNSSCSSCVNSSTGGLCGFNDSDSSNPFLCFPSSLHHLASARHRHPLILLLAALSAAAALSCLLLLLLFSLWAAPAIRRRWSPRSWRGDTMTSFLRRHHLHSSPLYTYDHLSSSTNGFHPRCKIGDGGFGSVYLARLDDGRIAAVKRLHRQHPATTTRSFCNEILILSSLRHPNLVRLHGYCCDPRGLLLVYEYVPNGTLADHLHGLKSVHRLTWSVRVDVALQIASALEYLHFSLKPPVVHRDITSNNIFMETDMKVKVGDFGLSRLLSLPADPNLAAASGSGSSMRMEEYVCCTGPQGTPGYLDPDYHRSFRLTEKSDVYSFGVVLLELVTGMRAVDPRRDKREVSLAELVVSKIQLGDLHQVVDPVLMMQGEAIRSIEAVAELAFRCVAGEKDDRPNAREIVEELRRIKGMTHEYAAAGGGGGQ